MTRIKIMKWLYYVPNVIRATSVNAQPERTCVFMVAKLGNIVSNCKDAPLKKDDSEKRNEKGKN